MALRNFQPPKVVNGKRLIVKQLINKYIEATILTGVGKREDVLIPKFTLIPIGKTFQFLKANTVSCTTKLCYVH